jgi:hypothetical protein
MRSLLCVIGRHEWRVKYDNEGRPFDICGRPGCYHVRHGDSPSDGPYTGTDRGIPSQPPNWSGPDGWGGGGSDGGAVTVGAVGAVGASLRARIGMRLAVAMRLPTSSTSG